MIFGAMIMTIMDASIVLSKMFFYSLLAAALVVTFVTRRRLFDEPKILLSGREPTVPKRRWVEVRQEQMARGSWTRKLIFGAVIAGLAWLTHPRPAIAVWIQIAWAAYFALLFGLWGLGVWFKYRLGKSSASQ